MQNNSSKRLTVCLILLVCHIFSSVGRAAGEMLPGFKQSPWFGEQTLEEQRPDGVRFVFNAPGDFDPKRLTLLIFYATPNGNSIEQTMGYKAGPGVDWHFDIQHIAAQTRVMRSLDRRRNIVLVCLETDGRSWPAWRQKHPDNPMLIRATVESALKRIPGQTVVTLAAHSGGGSFIFGFINAFETIPGYVERIVFLDANYAYTDEEKHGEKLMAWLDGDRRRHLVVIAYDDRNIRLDDKPVVGPTGGTYRATHRMIDAFAKHSPFDESHVDPFVTYRWNTDCALFQIHANQQNKILHSALVGEMNGFLHAAALFEPYEGKWGEFGGPRAYAKWIQPEATEPSTSRIGIPERPLDSEGGSKFMTRTAGLSQQEREKAIVEEFKRGNIPTFLGQFRTVTFASPDKTGELHEISYEVMPDYLAIGSDEDFVRIPMTPGSAQRIADAFGCSLPTRKMVNNIYVGADVKLEPRPLTLEREAVKTFLQHNRIIEEQRKFRVLGLLVAGIKKDVVITNLLQAHPGKVAIYGWHLNDLKPIQLLTTVHTENYVDYSHGIRLIKNRVLVDGEEMTVGKVLNDPHLWYLLSDEGPISRPSY